MKHILSLSKNFFKKNVKELLSFSIILLVSTMLFGGALVVKNNISKDYDKKFKDLNTANAFFTIPKFQYEEKLLQDIKNMEGIKEVEARKGIMISVPVSMGDSIQEQDQIFYNLADKTNMNKYNILEKSNEIRDNYIYLSNYTYINSGLKIDDNFEFSLNDIKYSFPINGVIEEMQYGNYSSSVIGQYVSNDVYEELLVDYANNEIITISVKSDNSYEAYNNISKYVNDENINIVNRNYDEQSKNGRLAISNILVLILTVFSFTMLLISLLVSKFEIGQSVEEDMENMGVLKALGYTSKEIMRANILPYIISGLLFSMLGIGVSYMIIPILSNVIMTQSGFVWETSVDLISSGIVLIINITLITMFTVLAAKKIKKLDPVNAIRGISKNTNTKNHFEIDKTKGNIELNLALKNFANTKKQNRLLGIVLFFITLVASFVGILYYNVNLNPMNFMNTLVEEYPNVGIVTQEDIKEDIKNMDNVKHVVYYDESASINYKDNVYHVFVAESFENLANDICYEGVNPSKDNEIAVGSKLVEMYDLKLGDLIEINKNGIEKQYEVVGFVQSVNYSGEIFEMTTDGYKSIYNEYTPKTIYVYLENGKNANEFIEEIDKNYGTAIEATVNYDKSMESAMDMYVSLVSLICIVIIIITILSIYLILYILISSIITKRKEELGILKAIGYRNRQLILELIGGFVPTAILSTMLGLFVSKLFMGNVYEVLFKAVGAYKVSFHYPMIVFVLISFFIVISTVLIGLWLSKKIKKISVYSLIKD